MAKKKKQLSNYNYYYNDDYENILSPFIINYYYQLVIINYY